MDTKYTRCPNCGMTAEGIPASAAPGGTPVPPSRGVAAGAGAQTPGVDALAPMTQAQGDQIIQLLRRSAPLRIDVVGPAVSASQILQVIAAVVLVVGVLGLIGAVVTAINFDFWGGILLGVVVAATLCVRLR
jgi:hypothetical protein